MSATIAAHDCVAVLNTAPLLNRNEIPASDFAAIESAPWHYTELQPGAHGSLSESHRARLLYEIGFAMKSLGSMAALICRYPDADATFDAFDMRKDGVR